MTANEVVSLLAYMSAAWPASEVTENTARVWTKHLTDARSEDALNAADVLIRDSEFFPSIAAFMAVVRPIVRRRLERETIGELDAAPEDQHRLSNEEVRALVADIKHTIAEGRKTVPKVPGLSSVGEALDERF